MALILATHASKVQGRPTGAQELAFSMTSGQTLDADLRSTQSRRASELTRQVPSLLLASFLAET